MAGIVMVLRLALAACLSGAAAGLLASLSIFFAPHLADPLDNWSREAPARLAELLATAEFGITLGIFVAGPPAFAAGSGMWALGRYSQSARHALAWAAVGGGIGAFLWALLELSFWTPGRGAAMTWVDAATFGICLASGAGGALVFRAAMRLGGSRGPVRRRRTR
jgi:hypothetical protein